MTVIRHKRGTGIPSPSDLKVGEIAIDTSTGTAYTKAGDGRIVPIGGNSSGGDGGGSGGPVAWDQITGKPTEFPPADHTHSYLSDAPDDGKLYGRQSENWEEVVISSVVYTLPVVLRSGDAQLPLTLDGTKLAVMTRAGELKLPLAA